MVFVRESALIGPAGEAGDAGATNDVCEPADDLREAADDLRGRRLPRRWKDPPSKSLEKWGSSNSRPIGNSFHSSVFP
eukprot:3501235-Prymnesium_polylepis.1